MEDLAIHRADVIKQMQAAQLPQPTLIKSILEPFQTHKLPWSLQLGQYGIMTWALSPSKCRKYLQRLVNTRQGRRALRREGLERDSVLLMISFLHIDLATMQIGMPLENGSFLGLPYRFFAKKAGWRTDEDDEIDKELINKGLRPKERGIKRVARYFEKMKAAGYIDVTCKSKLHNDGTYKGLAAIKRISPKLFYDLGVKAEQLQKCCEKAKKRLLEIRERYKQKLIRAANQQVQSVAKKLKLRFRQKAKDENQLKAKVAKIQQLRILPENKDLSASDFYLKYPSLRPDS